MMVREKALRPNPLPLQIAAAPLKQTARYVLCNPQSSVIPGIRNPARSQKHDVPTYTCLFWRFFEIFRSDLADLENILMVVLISSCRETAKNAIKKNRRGKKGKKKVFFRSIFWQKVFDMDFFQK
jgi:hypothetical protein